ncbi:MAG: hypothetical protein VXZ25_00745, partial [Pseudomonadota bacterium]|nr:hypothetical protein [Pseudomonadota bacterium]
VSTFGVSIVLPFALLAFNLPTILVKPYVTPRHSKIKIFENFLTCSTVPHDRKNCWARIVAGASAARVIGRLDCKLTPF